MKKILLLLTLSVGLLEVHAQDRAVNSKVRRKFSMGVQVSPSVDFFRPNTDGVEPDAAKVKFGYGLMIEYAFADNYAFVFGIEHKMAGASLSFSDARYIPAGDNIGRFELQTRAYKYDYVNLPLSLKLMTNEISRFTYFGQFGIDLSVLASAKARDEGQLYSTDSTFAAQQVDFRNVYSQTSILNVKLRVGAGAEWNFIGNTSLVFSITYHNGFIDLMRKTNAEKIAKGEGLYLNNPDEFDDSKTPFDLNANLHHVALNVGILF